MWPSARVVSPVSKLNLYSLCGIPICFFSLLAFVGLYPITKGHIRGPKGHSALWKRPSENPGIDRPLSDSITYYEVTYRCIHGGRKGKGSVQLCKCTFRSV